jgi:hypothetical protein
VNKHLLLTAVSVLATAGQATALFPGWEHSGSVFILTTPGGVDLCIRLGRGLPPPRPVAQELLRLWSGENLRFSSAKGELLAYQLEEWDAAKGVASGCVRVPKITATRVSDASRVSTMAEVAFMGSSTF